jgi:hypothetical protein
LSERNGDLSASGGSRLSGAAGQFITTYFFKDGRKDYTMNDIQDILFILLVQIDIIVYAKLASVD